MIGADFLINSNQSVENLRGIGDRAANARPALTAIRELIKRGHQQNFANRGASLGQPWPALKPGTLAQKHRKGQSSEPMVGTGALQQGVAGGTGQYTRVLPTSVRVGLSADLFYSIFHQGKGGDRLPTRVLLGVSDVNFVASIAMVERWVMEGI